MYDAEEKRSPGTVGITRLGADRSGTGAVCAGENPATAAGAQRGRRGSAKPGLQVLSWR